MGVSKEIKQIQGLVKELLENDPKYRDCDKTLSAKIWSIQLGGMEKLHGMTAYDFLCEYVKTKGKLYSQESIGRARRKLQEQNINLRGKSYKEKKAKQKDVKEVLGYN